MRFFLLPGASVTVPTGSQVTITVQPVPEPGTTHAAVIDIEPAVPFHAAPPPFVMPYCASCGQALAANGMCFRCHPLTVTPAQTIL
jgi:hypothetical protein